MRGPARRRRRHAERPAPRARASTRRRRSAPGPMLTEQLAQLERLQPVFEAVAAVSEPFEGVYLVGGTVRDILLGERSFDVDIAVEGDAIALAQALADALGGRVRAAREVRHGGGDLRGRRARRRRHGSHRVLRRAGGAADGRARFDPRGPLPPRLHDQRDGRVAQGRQTSGGSSTPSAGGATSRRGPSACCTTSRSSTTRRGSSAAIRYENRYGFRMDEHTLRLARGTIEMGLVGDLSSARLRDELVALLEEGERRALDPAAWPSSAPTARSIRTSPPTRRPSSCSRRLTALRDRYGLAIPAWRLGLAALARRLPPDEVYDWLQRLKVRRRDAERIAAAVTVGPRIVERLREGRRAGRGRRARRSLRTRRTALRARSRRLAASCTRTSSGSATCGWR